jgi:hypothetical protein
MPRYHFYLVDDVKGVELASDYVARHHAEQLARSSFGEPYRAVRVVSHNGRELCRVRLKGPTTVEKPADTHDQLDELVKSLKRK